MQRRSVVLVVIILALLAVALILPTAASGKAADSSWVRGAANQNNAFLPFDWHAGMSINVQKTGDDVKGIVIQKVLRSPDGYHYLLNSKAFTDPFWSPDVEGVHFYHGEDYAALEDPDLQYPAGEDYLPEGIENAEVADVIVFYPVSQFPFDLGLPSGFALPYRIVLFDYGEPGKGVDLVQVFVPDLATSWWAPNSADPGLFMGLPESEWAYPDPILSGNIQVHVGESETDG
jgi:hypothetical protein